MAQSDTRTFLVDLFTRFDPNLDLSEGSDADAELIQPILERIGTDPFDDDMLTFVRTRISQVRPDLPITEADELTDLVLDPMRVLLEPLTREIKLVKLRTSLNNIDSLSDDEVDALMANFFEARRAGGYAIGVVRAFFPAPQTVSVTLVHLAQSKGGLRYTVTRPQQITADQMLLNIEGSEYYFDINYTAENRGSEYNVEKDEIISISNLPTATRVRNVRRFTSGIQREDSATYVARVQQGSSDKTLTTQPGIVAVLNDNFPELEQVFEIGYGDPEMERDIITGGSLGEVPEDDDLGQFYGYGGPVDDLDANTTSDILQATGGNFVTRIGAVGIPPQGWFVTLSYDIGTLVVVDAEVLEVLANNRIKVAHEMPLTLGASAVTWTLREKKLTISDVPGGITFPDTPDGNLEIRSDKIHVGGKTDIFIAGSVEEASSQISGLTDERPLARGFSALTVGTDIIDLIDIDPELYTEIVAGMSVVLSEGVDVGAYRILEKTTGTSVRVDTTMSGSQSNLTWKVVDEIDVNLVEPKDILLQGADLIMSANSGIVTTAGATNFLDAGTAPGDILFADNDDFGGDFTITQVNAVSLIIDPPAPRSLFGVSYVISRRSEGVQRPILRVKSMELLDSSGAPNGTEIPYRDPVLVVSNGFQNEGAGFVYDGPAILGLVTTGLAATTNLNLLTMNWSVFDPDRIWAGALASGTMTWTGIALTPAQIVSQINADATLQANGVRAVVLSYAGVNYVGVTSLKHFRVTGGTGIAALGFVTGMSNCLIRPVPGATSFTNLKLRRGDLIECADGNNAGTGVRVITDPSVSADRVVVGTGPLGPPGTVALYNNATLSPDAGGRIRVARASVGSVRAYYLDPTSAEFDYETTRMSVTLNGQPRSYRPDPENTRTLLPPPPSTTLPSTATVNGGAGTLTDTDSNFLRIGVKPGDLLDVLYRPIVGTTPLAAMGNIAVAGLTLSIRLDNDAFILVSFPYAMPRADVVDYINEQVGSDIASLATGGELVLKSSRRIELSTASTALGVLFLATFNTDHPNKGIYVVGDVDAHILTVSSSTPFIAGTTADTHYQIRRYLQRISSTEMNLNVDASGLYYATIEAVSVLPGDYNNIANAIELEITGHRGDGYRLFNDNPVLSFSRNEELRAEISRTILLVGASDNPDEFVQLNLQNVQINYERSALVDDVQSFCSSRSRRVINEDILVRHLLPHYVSLNWTYSGGVSEPEATRAIIDYLSGIAGGDTLEVVNLVDVLKRKQATSVFTPDTSNPLGRSSPLILVVAHDQDRKIKGQLVRDIVDTVRTQRYIADQLVLRRLSSAGLR